MIKKLLCCYIPAMDFRRINTADTPYIAEWLHFYPWVRIKTLPQTDLVPTLLTGVYPHEHGKWQVKLRFNPNGHERLRLIDKLPDSMTTTFQCLMHLFTGSFDLAAMPSWRRRRFELKRIRYMTRTVRGLNRAIGMKTLFTVIGEEATNYSFSGHYNELGKWLPKLCTRDYRFQLFELHSLDHLSHWNCDTSSRMSDFYKGIDRFVQALHEQCQKNNVTLTVFSDHGQEPVKGSVDIKGKLRRLNLSRYEYTFFVDIPAARFWFHTDRARKAVVEMLSSLDHGTVLSYKDMHQYNMKFDDDQYGEIYFIADPGYILFPHDFYHPLANLFLGLTDWQERSRISSPKHRGMHGYLPHHESEKGFMIFFDDRFKARQQEANIIDFAPTVLGLLGYEKPDFMRGHCVIDL